MFEEVFKMILSLIFPQGKTTTSWRCPRRLKKTLLYFFFFLFTVYTTSAQDSNCENLGFELGNFINWTGYTWLYSTDVTSVNTAMVEGIVNRRQTIMSDTTAYDANTGYSLRKIPEGYQYSVRLGDEITSSDGNPRCWQQSLRYTMTIDSSNALLIFKFAVVLQYASDHTADMEPRFRLQLYDENGSKINDCSNYDVYATSKGVEGFNVYYPSGNSSQRNSDAPVNWRDWTTVGADLMDYYGQTITIEFMATDCTGRYHYGYAYFVAACHPLNITVNYCSGDTVAKLTAPEGFESYTWTDEKGQEVDTVQALHITNPDEGITYTCTMHSETGCTISLESSVAKYLPQADFTSEMIDCNSNTVKFTNLSTTTKGTKQFIWDFGDGTLSMAQNPYHTFNTSGMHTMRLILLNPPSSCTDTIVKDVESFSPPLVGIEGDSTFCPDESVVLRAYGAYEYTWNYGSKADSIVVSDPGGNFWLMGKSSTGCISDTNYITITEQPEWYFLSESDTIFCSGDSSLLYVSGAYSYLWGTGDTVNTIFVNTPGQYKVIGADVRGCEKELSFNVIKYPLPEIDFEVTPQIIDTKHSEITGSVLTKDNVGYLWNFGDGSSETSIEFRHVYKILDYISMYTVSIIATNEYDCMDSASVIIEVVPYVPNVFTPNGDDINDIFMKGYNIIIYDRNGLLIYEGMDGWDGTHNGSIADPDTYFYALTYSDKDENKKVKKGYITLVR